MVFERVGRCVEKGVGRSLEGVDGKLLQQIGVAKHIILLYFSPCSGSRNAWWYDGKLLQQIGVAFHMSII